MKIAILTLGTRGDVQPYAVLGRALQQRGHEVTLATARNFESLVASYGIGFAPVEADYQALLDSDEGKKMLKANPLAIRRNLATHIYPLVTQSLDEFYALAKASDWVLYHVKTLADCFADQFPSKMIRALVVPAVEPTTAFANPAFSGLPIPGFLRKASYKLTALGMQMMKKPIAAFRQKHGLPKQYQPPATPVLYGISPWVLDKPIDYPASSVFTGYWFGTSETELSADLMAFIQAGEPPLLLTFGSMPFKSKFDLSEAIVKATQKLGTRIIVVKGWGLGNVEKLAEHPGIKVIDSAPYEKLFPMVRAVVHHGGAGTTAECLRAGKPSFVCPVMYPVGDQQFWGELLFKKGLGVASVPVKKLAEETFLNSLAQLVGTESLYENAAAMAQKLSEEDGLANAVRVIERGP